MILQECLFKFTSGRNKNTMKGLIALLLLLTTLSSCNNNAGNDEKQDSIAADQAADSMLEAATSADTTALDGTVTDTSGTVTLQLQNKK